MFRTGFSVHHQESSTVHTAIGICHTGYADCLLANSQQNLYVLLCVQYQTPDDGQRNCPKHVEFYSKNKIEKLVYLDGFIASSQQNLYDIYLLLCIQYQTPDDGQQTCPKHAEFYFENKVEKLVHLDGLIIRIYHNARSPECQTEAGI